MLRRARYKVKEKTFVNGSLYEPGQIVEAPGGLEGAALELLGPVEAALALDVGGVGYVVGADAAAERFAALERDLAAERDARDQASSAIAEASQALAAATQRLEEEVAGRKADGEVTAALRQQLEAAVAEVASLRQQLEAAQAAKPAKR